VDSQEYHTQYQQKMDSSARNVKSSPGNEPAQYENDEQQQKKEVGDQAHKNFLLQRERACKLPEERRLGTEGYD
jgi:hypothetical protein